ncbi:hypothetical protein C8J56DRAFT_1041997 [Mycena floridula]|nr:hypothetical protein C8J56DRAFT_1041997 [Mycena floridula]
MDGPNFPPEMVREIGLQADINGDALALCDIGSSYIRSCLLSIKFNRIFIHPGSLQELDALTRIKSFIECSVNSLTFSDLLIDATHLQMLSMFPNVCHIYFHRCFFNAEQFLPQCRRAVEAVCPQLSTFVLWQRAGWGTEFVRPVFTLGHRMRHIYLSISFFPLKRPNARSRSKTCRRWSSACVCRFELARLGSSESAQTLSLRLPPSWMEQIIVLTVSSKVLHLEFYLTYAPKLDLSATSRSEVLEIMYGAMGPRIEKISVHFNGKRGWPKLVNVREMEVTLCHGLIRTFCEALDTIPSSAPLEVLKLWMRVPSRSSVSASRHWRRLVETLQSRRPAARQLLIVLRADEEDIDLWLDSELQEVKAYTQIGNFAKSLWAALGPVDKAPTVEVHMSLKALSGSQSVTDLDHCRINV